VDTLQSGELLIEVTEHDGVLTCVWTGTSNEPDSLRLLRAWFDTLLAEAADTKASIEMHFEKLEHFNSSTITALIKLIQACRKSTIELVMVYDHRLKWQRLSFDALRVFHKSDDLFRIQATSAG
jgi:hypothetical protein